MAAFLRGVISFVSTERNVFLSKRSEIIVESKRYVRGLKRKPVKVLFPENETGKAGKPPPEAPVFNNPAAKQNATKTTSKTEQDKTIKKTQVTVSKDSLDGLRFERASPGDKRLS